MKTFFLKQACWFAILTLGNCMPAIGQTMVVAHAVKNPSCYNAADGQAWLKVRNVQDTISIQWAHNGAVNDTVTGLSAGYYAYTVVDSAFPNTPWHDSVRVTNPDPLNVVLQAFSPSCPGFSNGIVALNATGGTPPYTYSWSNGAASQNLFGITAGVYEVTVTDAQGCSVTATTFVEPRKPLAVNASIRAPSCYQDSDGSIALIVSGGTAPYSFTWSDGSTGPEKTGLEAASYEVTVTDLLGCSEVKEFEVPARAPLVSQFRTTAPSCYGVADAAAEAIISGGTPPYAINWFNGATTPKITNMEAGNYRIQVTDNHDCLLEDEVHIPEQDSLMLRLDQTGVTCPAAGDGRVKAAGLGGTPPYSYNWSYTGSHREALPALGQGSALYELPPGTYSLLLTDRNGCTQEDSVSLGVQGSCLEFANLYFAGDPQNNRLLINGANLHDFTVEVYGISAGVRDFSYQANPYMNSNPLIFEQRGTYKIVVQGPGNLLQSKIREKIIVK